MNSSNSTNGGISNSIPPAIDGTPKTPRTLLSLLRPFYQFIFPPVCFACGSSLEEHERRVCSACWGRIRPVTAEEELYMDTLTRLCERGNVAGLVSCFYFDKDRPLQSLIHQMKYGGMTSLGVLLGEKIGEHVARMPAGMEVDVVVAIPLHHAKRRERGYNQSEYLCRGIQRKTGLPVLNNHVRRVKYTRSQTALDIEERRKNVARAFVVHPRGRPAVADRSILLVDDVITTGATMDACAHELMANGARRVVACSIALAP